MTSLRPPASIRPRRLLALAAAAPLVAGIACNSPSAGSRDGGPGDSGAPISAPTGQWTWIDVPGTACDDGTPTGIAVNPSPDASSRALFVYFMGGGACWDAGTCFVLNTSTHGPFGRAQWEGMAAQIDRPLDRTRATNPVRAASYVFIPYCTGDLHGGSNVATYDVLGSPRPFHHVGHSNVLAALPQVRATWPDATRVTISGSSAGGFGATLNYDTFRRAYPAATVALVDDAGPFLEGSNIPPDQHANWNAAWHLNALVDPLCPSCTNDLSQIYPALAALYPSDRMALLSSLQDQVIRTYFLILLGSDYEAKLRALITDRLDPLPHFHTFLIPGETHTLLGTMDTTMSGGMTLEAWLGQMLSGAAEWTSVGG
jgi:hypothetical protein